MAQQLLDAEDYPDDFDDDFDDDSLEIVTELDISHLVIEDDTPVDNFQSEIQQRLLVEPIYSSKALPAPVLAAANVGLFYKLHGDPIVPDMLFSLGVQRAEDFSERRNRSYFVWELGKVPDVCVEVVSNLEGDELSLSQKSRRRGKTLGNKDIYAQIGVSYYVVFDPLRQLQGEADMNGALLRVWALAVGRYSELTPASGLAEVGQFVWLDSVGLGLTLWQGQFEDEVDRLWLRWCDQQGRVIPTGAERANVADQRAAAESQRAETEHQRAEIEHQRAERLAERLRTMGINPDEV